MLEKLPQEIKYFPRARRLSVIRYSMIVIQRLCNKMKMIRACNNNKYVIRMLAGCFHILSSILEDRRYFLRFDKARQSSVPPLNSGDSTATRCRINRGGVIIGDIIAGALSGAIAAYRDSVYCLLANADSMPPAREPRR